MIINVLVETIENKIVYTDVAEEILSTIGSLINTITTLMLLLL